MINSVSNNIPTTNVNVNDSSKMSPTVDRQVSDLPTTEIVNRLDSKDLTIKDQVKQLAYEPPVDKNLVNQIKAKVEQGIYPIDLDLVTQKMFESFQETGSK